MCACFGGEWYEFPVHTAGHTGVTHLSTETTFHRGACDPADALTCHSNGGLDAWVVYLLEGGLQGGQWVVSACRAFPS